MIGYWRDSAGPGRIQSQTNGLFTGRPFAFQDVNIHALKAGLHKQAQRCCAGVFGLRRRSHHEKKRFALAGSQMQATQGAWPQGVCPAKQGSTGIVTQNLFYGPKDVAWRSRRYPVQTVLFQPPIEPTVKMGRIGRGNQENAALARQASQTWAQK